MSDEDRTSSWRTVVGVIGIVLASLGFLDDVGDLMRPLMWSPEAFRGVLTPEFVESIEGTFPLYAWEVVSGVVGGAIWMVLFVGAVLLLKRRGKGATLCRAWSLLAIPWVLIQTAYGLWWVSRMPGGVFAGELERWEGVVDFGIVLGGVLGLVFPVFVLVWLGRERIRMEVVSWPR